MSSGINSTTIGIESWFIPIDILLVVSSILVVLLSIIFLLIAATDKTCRPVSMMLISNSCLSELVFGLTTLEMAVLTLNNDMKQIAYEDLTCKFRGYMGFVASAFQNYSYILQAIYRYITVVYPSRLTWASARIQAYLIVTRVPLYLTGYVTYDIQNQICQGALDLSVQNVYKYVFLSAITIIVTIYIYVKLIRFVYDLNACSTSVNVKHRAKRELKLLRRVVILVSIIVTLGLPYCLFLYISFFTTPPKNHFRIAYIFVDVSLVSVVIVLFKFTDPIYKFVRKMLPVQATIDPATDPNVVEDRF